MGMHKNAKEVLDYHQKPSMASDMVFLLYHHDTIMCCACHVVMTNLPVARCGIAQL